MTKKNETEHAPAVPYRATVRVIGDPIKLRVVTDATRVERPTIPNSRDADLETAEEKYGETVRDGNTELHAGLMEHWAEHHSSEEE